MSSASYTPGERTATPVQERAVRYRGLLVILDGAGDRPIPHFGGRTPLEAARTPVLDRVAAQGLCGLVDPLSPGMPVDTHTGVAALMGLSPKQLATFARGPVEAIGAGLDMLPGDVLLRCNFATVAADDGGFAVLDRRAGRISEGTEELAAALDVELSGGVRATLFSGTHHRAVLRLRGPSLSAHITDTDPGAAADPCRVQQCRPLDPKDCDATRTAGAVNAFVGRAVSLLTAHPVNQRRQERGLLPATGVLTRSAGSIPEVHSLVRYLGLRAAVVAGEQTIHGLAHMLGYALYCGEGFTSMPDTDLDAKVDAARHALGKHQLVVMHIKAPDIHSHDLDPEGKRDVFERIDTALAGLLADDLVVGISADHSTDSNTGRHCGDPVPSLLRVPGGRSDDCASFGEGPCATGGLGRLCAAGFFVSLLDGMGALDNYVPAMAEYLR